MNKSRISMAVAAAGLMLVGLLAAVLFQEDDKNKDKATSEDTEEVVKMDSTTPAGNALLEVLNYEQDPVPEPETVVVNPTEPTTPAAPAQPESPANQIIEYTVQGGDMISKLAARFNCTSADIYRLNEGLTRENAHKIKKGQVLLIPVGGAEAIEAAGNTPSQPAKAEEPTFSRREVVAKPGDTAMQLAIEHYGAVSCFRMIMEANPGIRWGDRLKGGETIVLPEWMGSGTETAQAKPEPAPTVEKRNSIIPPRR